MGSFIHKHISLFGTTAVFLSEFFAFLPDFPEFPVLNRGIQAESRPLEVRAARASHPKRLKTTLLHINQSIWVAPASAAVRCVPVVGWHRRKRYTPYSKLKTCWRSRIWIRHIANEACLRLGSLTVPDPSRTFSGKHTNRNHVAGASP